MKYTNDFLLNELQKYYEIHGIAPTARTFHIAANTYCRRFGTWTDALRKANIPITSPKQIFKYCKQCNTKYVYHAKDKKVFCNSSCSAKYNNKRRNVSEQTKRKISKSLKLRGNDFNNPRIDTRYLFKQKISGDYSSLFICKCKHCSINFVNRTQISYCKQHINLYSDDNYNRYRFKFSISQYPNLFSHMSESLRTIGIRSETNLYGLTRDHKVSINEAIRNNYDPYYIKHPLNCEIMPWLENIRKNSNSSITYEELKLIVDFYDNNI